MSSPLSPITLPAQKQLKYTAGIANASVRESAAFMDQTRKVASLHLCLASSFIQLTGWLMKYNYCLQMMPIGQLSMKKLAVVGQGGKLWRWKRSHHQWLLQFKWKWQKPWKLSEWIRHSDETIMRARPRQQALPDIMCRNGR